MQPSAIRRQRSVPFAVCLLTGMILLLEPPIDREAKAASVRVADVEGRSHSGELTGLSAETIELSAGNQPRTFSTKDVRELRFEHPRLRSHVWGAVIFLANGDRLLARPETIDDTKARARWVAFPGWKSVEIPLETIAGFILDVPEIAAGRSQALRTVMDRRQNADLVDLKNGDQVKGEFLGLSDKTLRLDSSVGETDIERDGIRLVTMNRELISFPPVEGPAMLLSLTDGSRLTVTELKLQSDGRLSAQAAFGAELDLPLSEVSAIRCLGGRAVYVSDLPPVDYKHTAYLAGTWELKTDKNVLGQPLRLDGVEYPKGLGMHSQSSASYDLAGKYQTFRARIGLDDAAGGRGSAVFAVEVDGKEVFRSEPQTAQAAGIELPPIPLAGAKRLTLKVEFGPFGDVLDYADWCDAVLIKP